MNKIIRWPGLVAFVVIASLLIGVPLLFLDTWIKRGIESFGSKALGAEVNVAAVSHSWSPLGLTLKGVQLTDADKNTHNKVAFETLHADVALMPLFDRKVIIEALQVQGVKFDTPRTRPGKVYASENDNEKTATADVKKKLTQSADDIDVAALVKKTPLKTDNAATALSESSSRSKTELAQQFEALPDEQALKTYQQQVQAILDRDIKNATELAQAKKELDVLKKALRAEQQKIKDFSQSVSTASNDLQQSLSELAAAQQQDYDLLKGLVGGDAAAIDNLTNALFGVKLKSWADNLLAAYRLVLPLLQGGGNDEPKRERMAGRWISFTEHQPLPELWIKKAEVSVNYKASEFSSFWKDITSDHALLGRPTSYTVDSAKTAAWQGLQVVGNFKLLAAGLSGAQTWDLKGVVLDSVDLAQTDSLNSTLQQALLNSVGKIEIADNKLQGRGDIKLADMLLKASGSGKTSETIANFLGDLTTLDITTKIAGYLQDPQLGFSSDLDSQLAQQLSKTVDAAAQKKLDELKSQIAKNATPTQAEAAAQLTDWQNLKDIANGKNNAVDDMLQAQIDDVVDKEKDKLKNQLQKKLLGG